MPYTEHPLGNYALYGLNMIGCDSIIRFNNKIYKFKYFKDRDAIYYDVENPQDTINLSLQYMYAMDSSNSTEITRMVET